MFLNFWDCIFLWDSNDKCRSFSETNLNINNKLLWLSPGCSLNSGSLHRGTHVTTTVMATELWPGVWVCLLDVCLCLCVCTRVGVHACTHRETRGGHQVFCSITLSLFPETGVLIEPELAASKPYWSSCFCPSQCGSYSMCYICLLMEVLVVEPRSYSCTSSVLIHCSISTIPMTVSCIYSQRLLKTSLMKSK